GGEPLSITRVYGAGVHAYFSGDYLRCYDDLTDTIEAGSRDPRTRYFRGLAALCLGRLDEAEADFSEGAQLEAEAGGNWPVSRSLERVQGNPRFQLERHRARARVAALQQARERESTLYGEGAARPEVIRDRIPAGQPTRGREDRNPFADESGAAAAPVERGPEPETMPPPAPELPPKPDESDDPFGNSVRPQPETSTGVGAESGVPTEKPAGPGESPPADDPFGDATLAAPELPAEPVLPDAGTAPAPGGE
ncbi:MAG: hypothetical protein ACKOSQ_01265, partial [Planctomycetaceae bacterium]